MKWSAGRPLRMDLLNSSGKMVYRSCFNATIVKGDGRMGKNWIYHWTELVDRAEMFVWLNGEVGAESNFYEDETMGQRHAQ